MNARFMRLLRRAEVLSLDIFDTTLARRCAKPEDVTLELTRRAVAKFGVQLQDFTQVRREAEHGARRLAWERRQAEDTVLAEIYEQIAIMRADWEPFIDLLQQDELALERALLYPLPLAQEMISAARQLGKKVIFVSDMYLPKSFCEEVLRSNGFADFDAFFLSSHDGLLKNTGNLFSHVIKTMGCAPSVILHVGDNPHADGVQARAAGMITWSVPKAIECMDRFERNPVSHFIGRPEHGRSWGQSLMAGLSAQHCLISESDPKQDFWQKMGVQFAAPVLYGYVRYLVEQLSGRGLQRVYFLSRDGYILKKLYQLITSGRSDCPEAIYLHASRRALNFAAISELTERNLPWLMEGVRLTIGQFLQRIGLNPVDFNEQIRAVGFRDADHPVVEGADYGMLRQLYQTIAPQLLAAAADERQCYMEYMRSLGVFKDDRVVLVDVGWMTSIQHSLAAMIRSERPNSVVEGYYVGTYAEARYRADERTVHNSWLMHYGEPATVRSILRHCVPLLEFFFASPEHTLLRIQRTAEGELQPLTASFHENEKDLPILTIIHQAAMDYTAQMVRAGPDGGPVLDAEDVVEVLQRMLCAPSRMEARLLGRLHYADGYGAFFNHTYMACCPGLRGLGLSKQAWKRDFKSAHWPRGYVAALGPIEQWIFHRMYPNARYVKEIG